MKKILYLTYICLIVLGIGCRQKDYKVVCGNGFSILAKVADTDSKRIQGLMSQKNLRENEGMLFIYENEGKYGFWMKNMNFPLDIIWLDKDKRVVDIKNDIQPCINDNCPTVYLEKEAFFVLEVNAGFANRHNINKGILLYWA